MNSNAKMAWKIFDGRHHERYMPLLKERCLGKGLSADDYVLKAQFRLHMMHGGFAYLASNSRLRYAVAAFAAQALEQGRV